MALNGTFDGPMDPKVQEAFSNLSELEKDFAAVELDALRQKEFSCRELYAKRSALTSVIPSFWSEIFMSGAVPAALGAVLTPVDAEILSCIESLDVERYQIKSDTEGEPRSLRFTFGFAANKYFSDKTVVKEFEYKAFGDGPGGYVSKPVNFNWKMDAKKDGINKFLDLAAALYKAEETFAQKGGIDQKEREALWQHEKLREELEKEENQAEDNDGHSFLEWFGYRGAVNTGPKPKAKSGDAEDESEDEDEDDGTLDVEIFPAGEDVAIAIAEDLWPNVMDYFIQATSDDVEMDSDEEEDDDDAPQLVPAEDSDAEEAQEVDPRPAKKRKITS